MSLKYVHPAMTYYLQESPSERRLIIGNRKLPGCQVESTTKARSWIEAKRNLGFELSWLQDTIFRMQFF